MVSVQLRKTDGRADESGCLATDFTIGIGEVFPPLISPAQSK
jgi:hypothetical protein